MRQAGAERRAEQGGEDDGYLLAGGLPAYEEATSVRGRYFGEVDRDCAEFGSGGKSLDETAGHDQKRG